MFIKYLCNPHYTMIGSDTVACYSDDTWSELPKCEGTIKSTINFILTRCFINDHLWKEFFCSLCADPPCELDPRQYSPHQYNWGRTTAVQYIKEGEIKYIPCGWQDWSVLVSCINRVLTLAPRCKYTLHFTLLLSPVWILTLLIHYM